MRFGSSERCTRQRADTPTRAMSIQAFVFLLSLRGLQSETTILPAKPFKIFVGAEYAKNPLWKKVIDCAFSVENDIDSMLPFLTVSSI
jgi:hypothetical protein